MSVANIAAALGRACRSGGWWRCCCPAHASWGATLAIIIKCHAGCSRGNILAELRRRGLHNLGDLVDLRTDPAATECRRTAEALDGQHRIARAMDRWRSSWPVHRTVVELYLRSRGITIEVPRVIGSCRCISRHGAHASGSVAPDDRGIEDDDHEPVAVHSTYLAFLAASGHDQYRHLQSSHSDVNGSAHHRSQASVSLTRLSRGV
jgi:hypothetical protein